MSGVVKERRDVIRTMSPRTLEIAQDVLQICDKDTFQKPFYDFYWKIKLLTDTNKESKE